LSATSSMGALSDALVKGELFGRAQASRLVTRGRKGGGAAARAMQRVATAGLGEGGEREGEGVGTPPTQIPKAGVGAPAWTLPGLTY
jgi:hypothetical protein